MPGPCLADGQRPWADSRLPCLWPWDPSVTCMPSIMTAELGAGWPGGAPCPLWTGLPAASPLMSFPPVLQPEQPSLTSAPVRATACPPWTWPPGCPQANEPHEPHETCPALRATRVSGAPAALPSQPGGGAERTPLLAASSSPRLLTQAPGPLSWQ